MVGTSRSGTADFPHDNFACIALDLSDPASIAAAGKAVANLGKKVDALINNAGVSVDVMDGALDVGALRKTLEVNLVGLADFTNRILPLLNKPAHVISISSVLSSLDEPLLEVDWYVPSYKISKAALNMYTQCMAWQLREQGVTVSALDPGWVKTDMGGPDAVRKPEDAARDIYNLATATVESGQFWREGKKRSW